MAILRRFSLTFIAIAKINKLLKKQHDIWARRYIVQAYRDEQCV
jgi:hypothetical protein